MDSYNKTLDFKIRDKRQDANVMTFQGFPSFTGSVILFILLKKYLLRHNISDLSIRKDELCKKKKTNTWSGLVTIGTYL